MSPLLKHPKALNPSANAFIKNMLGSELWEIQRDIIDSVFTNSKTAVKSCHASGKSFVSANAAIAWLMEYPLDSAVLTTAPTWRQIEKVMWKEIRSLVKGARMDLGGNINATEWTLGEKWFGIGISTNDPDRFNGLHSKHLLIIKDESSGIPQVIHDAIEGVGSTGHVVQLDLGNPTDPTGTFAKEFNSPFYNKFTISCFHTPNFVPWRVLTATGGIDVQASLDKFEQSTYEERVGAITHGYLISPQWVFERLVSWGRESGMFMARCLGEFPPEGDDTLISLRNIEKATIAYQNGSNDLGVYTPGIWPGDDKQEVIGADIARFGGDKTVLVYRKGNAILEIIRYEKQDLMTTAHKIAAFHDIHPYAKIMVDVIGIGAGVVDKLVELRKPVTGVNVALPAQNQELYLNSRAENYFELSQSFARGDIVMLEDEALESELASIKYKYQNGKLAIESKDEMKKRGLSSPDSADALMLTFAKYSSSGIMDFMREQLNQ